VKLEKDLGFAAAGAIGYGLLTYRLSIGLPFVGLFLLQDAGARAIAAPHRQGPAETAHSSRVLAWGIGVLAGCLAGLLARRLVRSKGRFSFWDSVNFAQVNLADFVIVACGCRALKKIDAFRDRLKEHPELHRSFAEATQRPNFFSRMFSYAEIFNLERGLPNGETSIDQSVLREVLVTWKKEEVEELLRSALESRPVDSQTVETIAKYTKEDRIPFSEIAQTIWLKDQVKIILKIFFEDKEVIDQKTAAIEKARLQDVTDDEVKAFVEAWRVRTPLQNRLTGKLPLWCAFFYQPWSEANRRYAEALKAIPLPTRMNLLRRARATGVGVQSAESVADLQVIQRQWVWNRLGCYGIRASHQKDLMRVFSIDEKGEDPVADYFLEAIQVLGKGDLTEKQVQQFFENKFGAAKGEPTQILAEIGDSSCQVKKLIFYSLATTRFCDNQLDKIWQGPWAQGLFGGVALFSLPHVNPLLFSAGAGAIAAHRFRRAMLDRD